jgi:hypothetical protein
VVECTGFPQISAAPYTFMWYEATNSAPTPSGGTTMHHGSFASHKGWYVNADPSDGKQFYCWMVNSGNYPLNRQVTPTWVKWWHSYTFTFNPPTQFTYYLDGVVMTVDNPYSNPAPATGADPFGFYGVYQHVVAHIAYFDKLLTPAQINQLHSYRVIWPFGPMINAVLGSGGGGAPAPINPADPVIVDINTDLSDIRAAVIRTYPKVT